MPDNQDFKIYSMNRISVSLLLHNLYHIVARIEETFYSRQTKNLDQGNRFGQIAEVTIFRPLPQNQD